MRGRPLLPRRKRRLPASQLQMLLHMLLALGIPMKHPPSRRMPRKAGRFIVKGRVPPNVPCPCGALRPNGQPMKWKRCHGKAPPTYT